MPTRKELANAIRALSMDAVEKAKSGHPGMPMGMADIAEVLWNDYLQHNPHNPNWYNRDRFVVSNGHGSMLLYSLLHLTGYDLNIDELKNFRQLHSKTPGHPEYGYAPGIETTTGPLGQGLANGVGMAIAEKILAAQFNRDDHNIVDHYTYVFTGDGCLMEGISHEVCSLAGTLGLGKLIVIYDDNGISIDGPVAGTEEHPGWFTDDTPKRFTAYNWDVVPDVDGHDPDAIANAIESARNNTQQPTLICCKTIIGFGAPNKQGTASTHGAALGSDEVQATREYLDWDFPPFTVPDDIYAGWNAQQKGQELEANWQQQFASYQQAYPELAAELIRRMQGQLPDNFHVKTETFISDLNQKKEHLASRKASLNCLNFFGAMLPELLGGSADLAGSNLTLWNEAKGITHDCAQGNYIYYGVREFGMSAIVNGIALHGGFIPYGGTFLIFMEYARNAVRMAAIMKQRSIFIFTHDSIGLGEDGPTHQPIEQLTNLRTTPNMSTWRPCDSIESAVAWQQALERQDGPTALAFSRQTLIHQSRTQEQINNIKRGGYVLSDCNTTPQAILIATGSEVELAMQASKKLTQQGFAIRVVSMPSTNHFDAEDEDYKNEVLPANITKRFAIEAGYPDFWYKYVGLDGKVLGISRFGESAPAEDLFEYFGFTIDNIVNTVTAMIND